VRRWTQRFNREGIAGLSDRPRSGRPRLSSSRLKEHIRRLLAKGDPDAPVVLERMHQAIAERP
jgi:transposase